MAADPRFRFVPAARIEVIEAVEHYERARVGLGVRFLAALNRALQAIASEPERWPLAPRLPSHRQVRRHLLRGFPYAVIYRMIAENRLEVCAVAHYKRRPGYWKKR